MARQRQGQLIIDDCRRAYWNAIEHYESVRRDEYSSYRQLNDASAAVSTARALWMLAAERTLRAPAVPAGRRNAARLAVANETGEDPEWVLNVARNR